MATKDTNPKDNFGSKKPSMSTVPVPVLYELALAMTEGHLKGYRRHNYRVVGVRASIYYDAAKRHLDAWWEGEDIDPDSGLHHVVKAIASLVVLRDAMIQGTLEQDDRPPSSPAGWLDAMQAHMDGLLERYPNPPAPYTIEDTKE